MNRNNHFAPIIVLTLIVMTTLVMISTDIIGSLSQVWAQQETDPVQNGMTPAQTGEEMAPGQGHEDMAPVQEGEETTPSQDQTLQMPGLDGEVSPVLGEKRIVQHGIATSSPDPLPGHQAHQSVTILRLRDDNAVYSGRVTFTATQPIEVQILHRDLTNSGTTELGSTTLNVPDEFGKLGVLQLPDGKGQVTITNVVPKFTEGATGSTFAASVPYSGNAVALHNLEGKPFVATYTVTADVLGPAERVGNVD